MAALLWAPGAGVPEPDTFLVSVLENALSVGQDDFPLPGLLTSVESPMAMMDDENLREGGRFAKEFADRIVIDHGRISDEVREGQRVIEAAAVISVEDLLQGLVRIRKVLSVAHNPPIDAVLGAGLAPRLVALLGHADPRVQFEAGWALTNIASGTAEHTSAVVDAGVIPPAIALVSSPNTDVAEQMIWCIGNIAGDSRVYRDDILRQGGLLRLVDTTRERVAAASAAGTSVRVSFLRTAAWTLSNLCRGKPAPRMEAVLPSLPMLAHLLAHPDSETSTDAAWALAYMSEAGDDAIDAVIAAGVLPTLIEAMNNPSDRLITPALRAIGNVATGSSMHVAALVNGGALPILVKLTGHAKRGIMREATWTISNILADEPAAVLAAISTPGLVAAITAKLSCHSMDVAKEAAWAVSNSLSKRSAGVLEAWLPSGAFLELIKLLERVGLGDSRVTTVMLEGFNHALTIAETVGGAMKDVLHKSLLDADVVDIISAVVDGANVQLANEVLRKLGHEADFVGEE